MMVVDAPILGNDDDDENFEFPQTALTISE